MSVKIEEVTKRTYFVIWDNTKKVKVKGVNEVGQTTSSNLANLEIFTVKAERDQFFNNLVV